MPQRPRPAPATERPTVEATHSSVASFPPFLSSQWSTKRPSGTWPRCTRTTTPPCTWGSRAVRTSRVRVGRGRAGGREGGAGASHSTPNDCPFLCRREHPRRRLAGGRMAQPPGQHEGTSEVGSRRLGVVPVKRATPLGPGVSLAWGRLFPLRLFLPPPLFALPSQDFSLACGRCPEITVYTGCCYFPSAGQLHALWSENKKSLLSMLVEVGFGGTPGGPEGLSGFSRTTAGSNGTGA